MRRTGPPGGTSSPPPDDFSTDDTGEINPQPEADQAALAALARASDNKFINAAGTAVVVVIILFIVGIIASAGTWAIVKILRAAF